MSIEKMDLREFVEQGYLQEVNRHFFHPRGLALEVRKLDDGQYELSSVWDYREDPEGILYGSTEGEEFRRKAETVHAELEKHREAREGLLGGGIIQPLGWEGVS